MLTRLLFEVRGRRLLGSKTKPVPEYAHSCDAPPNEFPEIVARKLLSHSCRRPQRRRAKGAFVAAPVPHEPEHSRLYRRLGLWIHFRQVIRGCASQSDVLHMTSSQWRRRRTTKEFVAFHGRESHRSIKCDVKVVIPCTRLRERHKSMQNVAKRESTALRVSMRKEWKCQGLCVQGVDIE